MMSGSWRETIKKVTRQAKNLVNMFVNDTVVKGFTSVIHEECLQLNNNTNNPINQLEISINRQKI